MSIFYNNVDTCNRNRKNMDTKMLYVHFYNKNEHINYLNLIICMVSTIAWLIKLFIFSLAASN